MQLNTDDTVPPANEVTDEVAKLLVNVDCMDQKHGAVLDIVVRDDDRHTVEIRFKAFTKKSDNIFSRISKAVSYVLTGKFEAEHVFTISGVTEINDSLNTVRSVVYSVKKQADRWRWKI